MATQNYFRIVVFENKYIQIKDNKIKNMSLYSRPVNSDI